jgi:hypothetical protein
MGGMMGGMMPAGMMMMGGAAAAPAAPVGVPPFVAYESGGLSISFTCSKPQPANPAVTLVVAQYRCRAPPPRAVSLESLLSTTQSVFPPPLPRRWAH